MKKVYVQSAFRIPDEGKRSQETAAFRRSGDFFRKIVVTSGTRRPLSDENGVVCNDRKQGAAIEKGIAPDPDRFARDYDYMRSCAFLGIVKGCNGVLWWWFARDNCGKYYSAACSPKAWTNLVRVIKELRAIRPLVTADGFVVTGTAMDGKGRVEWWRKTVNGKPIFIAVNTADHPVSVTVAVPDDAPRKLTLRRYEVLTEGFN